MESHSNSLSQDHTAHPASQGASPLCNSKRNFIVSSKPKLQALLQPPSIMQELISAFRNPWFNGCVPSQSNKNHCFPKTSLQSDQAIPKAAQGSTDCHAMQKAFVIKGPCVVCLPPCPNMPLPWLQANQSNSPGHPQTIPAVAMRTSQSQQARLTESGSSTEGPCCTRQSALRATM